jgi:hypothetical protein
MILEQLKNQVQSKSRTFYLRQESAPIHARVLRRGGKDGWSVGSRAIRDLVYAEICRELSEILYKTSRSRNIQYVHRPFLVVGTRDLTELV